MKNEREINWEEVEIKVGVICSRFKNIRSDYIEDLAQELRIHAFHKSDDYYDLYRRAIDFWRTLQCRVYPELPYFDMEVFEHDTESKDTLAVEELLQRVYEELENDGYLPKEKELISVVKKILDILLEDIFSGRSDKNYKESQVLSYFGGKISITWISERIEEPYKKVQDSLSMLQEIVRGLDKMGKISLPDKYRS